MNLTVDATRAYRHMYTVQEGMFGSGGSGRPGRVIFCDSWSVATWEKDGIANNMKTVCSNSDDIETTAMLDGSKPTPLTNMVCRSSRDSGQTTMNQHLKSKSFTLLHAVHLAAKE